MQVQRRWWIRNLLLQHADCCIRLKRQRAGQEPVQHHANRIEVSPSVDLLAECLFRWHVSGRSQHGPVDRHVLGATHARDPEVHHFDAAMLGDHHVGRLHVPMHNAEAVRVLKRRQDLVGEAAGAIKRYRSQTLQQFLERLAANELHGDHEVRFRLEQFINRGDFRVVELGERRRFSAEPFDQVGPGKVWIQDLDCDLAIERLIYRFVHGAHSAPPELPDDSVFADGLTNHDGIFGLRVTPL